MIPGIPEGYREVSSGGTDLPWVGFVSTKPYTNAFIVQKDRILLGLKKRGFGVGKWNGFGGKVDPGEQPWQAAVRELQEEACITSNLEHCATIYFVSKGADVALHVDYYRASSYDGTPSETEEMRPAWFAMPSRQEYEASLGQTSTSYLLADASSTTHAYPTIPWDKLWEDDQYWFPLLLANKPFAGRVDFEEGFGKIRKWWFGTPEKAQG
ncbi:hypothetical protein PUNSTDRAFT_52383 [Punctularia strigosozonata HHB-11173 SS5]|uniref:uncharacterized protein n=1 Tax=Punctularia strigosozonata (strain HHB-11173) TaxID=741275 RepID=UPI0004416CCA|nr:uncharacterized protein PUNSTDRAFT_52383 [Punctularia strigosozonata HHB-11173 SS5]EIN08926.1 hypothetical protein PUNSTDRAFT_52383 [Punctularia strigosozonata HHB-11173 SS5]